MNVLPAATVDVHASGPSTARSALGSWRGALRFSLAVLVAASATTAVASDTVELRLASDEWPPFTGNPGSERAAIELVHMALDRAGIQASTEIVEWKAVETGIRRGDFDGSAAIWRTEQREKRSCCSPNRTWKTDWCSSAARAAMFRRPG